MEKVVIVGGGVAGLSCLNGLLDKGQSPLLLEEKTIGLPKICGEFIAPLASRQLRAWGIGPIQSIKDICFLINNKQSCVSFPEPAGAFSRANAELSLAKRASDKGGRIREGIRITKIEPPLNDSPYRIHLNSEELIETRAIIIATGKLNPQSSPTMFPYVGFKMYIPQVFKAQTLIMSHYSGAYFGMVPVADNVSNLTCLAQKKVVEQWGSCLKFFQHLMKINPLLAELDTSAIDWLEGRAPIFKAQKIPYWKNAFWIGDALASFYPAIGYGFAHSIHSALLATHFYLHGDAPGYNTCINQEIKHKLLMGKCLHHAFMNKSASNLLFTLTQKSPSFTRFLMRKAGYG
ncbi:MAG: FAD-dependent oxidoreductase [Legionella sp.]|nr:FAD-dependent oxidoreductase [Legionella sp.]